MSNDKAAIILINEQPHSGPKIKFTEEEKSEAYNLAIMALKNQDDDCISRKEIIERAYHEDEGMAEPFHNCFGPLVEWVASKCSTFTQVS